MSRENSYFKFFSFGLDNFASRSLIRIRTAAVEFFLEQADPEATDLVLDAGVSDEDHPSSNFLEKRYPYINRITGLSCHDFSGLEKVYPGFSFVQGDARKLPFEDRCFDFAYSHAVIEHVGNSGNQTDFIRELDRVTKKGFFFTTPNRLHPLEFHTGLPVIHYLPKKLHWKLYTMLGKGFYGDMNKLNLLTVHQIKHHVNTALGDKVDITVKSLYWMGFPAIIMIYVRKNSKG
ncbi:MAG: class I SAM-dependent methyltransferase [Kiritimatiellia bacterium]